MKPKRNQLSKPTPEVGNKSKKVKAEVVKPYSELDELDNRILRFKIEYPGATLADIADALNNVRSAEAIAQRIKRPAFVKAMEDVQMTAWDVLVKVQGLAARRLMRLVGDPDAKVSIKACEIALNPLVNKPPTLTNNTFIQMVHEVSMGAEGQVYRSVKSVSEDAKEVAQAAQANQTKASDLLTGVVDI